MAAGVRGRDGEDGVPGVHGRCRRVLASRCAGGWCARALSACAGVEVRGRLACAGLARAGYEGVARMWIGYEDVDRL